MRLPCLTGRGHVTKEIVINVVIYGFSIQSVLMRLNGGGKAISQLSFREYSQIDCSVSKGVQLNLILSDLICDKAKRTFSLCM